MPRIPRPAGAAGPRTGRGRAIPSSTSKGLGTVTRRPGPTGAGVCLENSAHITPATSIEAILAPIRSHHIALRSQNLRSEGGM